MDPLPKIVIKNRSGGTWALNQEVWNSLYSCLYDFLENHPDRQGIQQGISYANNGVGILYIYRTKTSVFVSLERLCVHE